MTNEQTTYKVTGMTCGGCARSVENAIRAVAPDAAIQIDQPNGLVVVSGATEAQIAKAVDEAGFDFAGKA